MQKQRCSMVVDFKRFITPPKKKIKTVSDSFHHTPICTTLPKMNECPTKRDYLNRRYIFKPLIFKGHVSFPGSTPPKTNMTIEVTNHEWVDVSPIKMVIIHCHVSFPGSISRVFFFVFILGSFIKEEHSRSTFRCDQIVHGCFKSASLAQVICMNTSIYICI